MAQPQPWVLSVAQQLAAPHKLPEYFERALVEADDAIAIEFMRSVYAELKNNPSSYQLLVDFAERVHRSERSLQDWLIQIMYVYRWLNDGKRSAKMVDVIEYASCAWFGGSDTTIQDYLESYGFERSWVRVG